MIQRHAGILDLLKGIGKNITPIKFVNNEEFIQFYHSISVKKGPLFDSNMSQHSSSQWTFFSILPKLTIIKKNREIIGETQKETFNNHNCFFNLMDHFPFKTPNDYPGLEKYPFIGGFVGFLSYENKFETLKINDNKKCDFPLYQFSLFTNAFIFDHQAQKSFLISDDSLEVKSIYSQYEKKVLKKNHKKIRLKPLISKEKYLSKIEEIFEHIRKGDIYQANFTHKFYSEFHGEPFSIYQALREKNPAPFACFYPINEKQFILCSSPERLFKVQGNIITSSPIKGTIRRDQDPFIDDKLKKDLLNSTKDSAELAMIVDLIRNDLGRISEFGSVKVLEFKKLESFQKVHHLIGTIEGKLRSEISIRNIFEALFPGGSITGAPKIRSIEILNELEEDSRGPYTGSAGYIDIRGNMDFNIMIRTILINDNQISLQVGGGIVIDSNPYCEYEETLHKAEALFDAL